jgi:hypothetical protein
MFPTRQSAARRGIARLVRTGLALGAVVAVAVANSGASPAVASARMAALSVISALLLRAERPLPA